MSKSNWGKFKEAGASNSVGKYIPSGVDLMNRINEGLVQKAPTEYVKTIRSKVVEACDELIDIGARVRPLMVGEEQVGWVRGVHNTERRIINRWIHQPNEYILHVLLLATTLTAPEIENFTALEIRNLVELVKTMSEYDVSLFPYLSAFATTMTSENLWHGKGQKLTAFENKFIELPDGKKLKVVAPPDHARLWASLCVYREQAKKRLDENWNAVLMVRPMAGKSVDGLSNELKGIARQLQTDAIEPWETMIRTKVEKDVEDGWAHPADDEAGLLRELKGMLANDKHEQLMAEFERQQIAQAEQRKQHLEQLVMAKGGVGINEEILTIETEEDVRKRERDLKRGKLPPPPAKRDSEVATDPAEKIKKYR